MRVAAVILGVVGVLWTGFALGIEWSEGGLVDYAVVGAFVALLTVSVAAAFVGRKR